MNSPSFVKAHANLVNFPRKLIFCIDLFCGAGGTTKGVHMARWMRRLIARVIYCINHDKNAIASHKANYKKVLHAIEDVRTHGLDKMKKMVATIRRKYPLAVILLWASLECTNFSKAKGGLSRDPDSRSLAHHMYRYIEAINPDCFWVENVEEFLKWGPVRWKHEVKEDGTCELIYDKKGRPVFEPIKDRYSEFYNPWVEDIKAYGYNYDYRLLNSADFGAYTSRKRLFIQFNKPHIPIVWPKATHAKNPGNGDLFNKPLKKWKAVKHVLDLEDTGTSIFNRNEPLVEPSLERIYAGLVKFVPERKTKFLVQRNGGNPEGRVVDIDGPARTLTQTGGNQEAVFIKTYHGTGNNVHDLSNPSPAIPGAETHAIVFIDRQFGNGTPQSPDEPIGALLGNPKSNLVTAEPFLIDTQYKNSAADINEPCRVITANRKHFYLLNTQWFNNSAYSVDQPCYTLIARMDKAPPYLVITEEGFAAIEIYETDSPATVKIKEFMAAHGIVDIKMRMLKIPELLRIQGFGDKYKLVGSKNQKKKYIGNSVVPEVVKAMIEATTEALYQIGYFNEMRQAA